MLAARSGRDFTAASPRRRPARKPDWRSLALAFAAAHWRAIGAGVVIAGLGGAVAANALYGQAGRHPAPLFAGARTAAAEPRKAEPAPLPPARPGTTGSLAASAPAAPRAAGPRDAIGDLIRTDQGPQAKAAAVAARPAARDNIGEMIRQAEPAAKAAPEPQRLVLSGQKALVKLGYGPLKTDGLMGPGTRQAIERFEKDRSLPVTGELAGRTLKALSAQAAMPVE